jgi:FkbM family methyltransferase
MNVLETRHGRMMVRPGGDLISANLAVHGAYEWDVVNLCAMIAGGYDDGTILDIGANIGTVTVPLAKAYPKYEVHAWEPQRLVYQQLCGNVAMNHLQNVYAYNEAVGAIAGVVELDMPDYATNGNIGAWSMSNMVREKSPEAKAGGKREPINCITLDGMGFNKIRLIKMDVEGFELDVLKGAANFLPDHNYPPIVYESWTQFDWYQKTAEEIKTLLTDMGYELQVFGNTVAAIHKEASFKLVVAEEQGGKSVQIVRK